MDLAARTVTPARFQQVAGKALESVIKEPQVAVLIRDSKEQEPQAILVSGQIFKELLDTHAAHAKMVNQPEFGGLQNEVDRLRKVAEALLKQLRILLGDEGKLRSGDFYNLVHGTDVPAGVAGESEADWTPMVIPDDHPGRV